MSEMAAAVSDQGDALADTFAPKDLHLQELALTDDARARLLATRLTLVEALNRIVRFEDQDPEEQFYPARCSDERHYWHENADAEGDTCNCGRWYRFADRIEMTPEVDP
jgi:hypothetical protein